MVKTKDSVLTGYQNHKAVQQELLKSLKSKLNTISFSRLGLFVIEIILIALIINFGFSLLFGVLLFLPLIFFMYLVKKQMDTQHLLSYHTNLLWVFENEINVIEGKTNGYANGDSYDNEAHHYASDLDIYGSGSLYALINRCNTHSGLALLADNLGRPAEMGTILARQEAIQEVVQEIESTFTFRAELQGHKPTQIDVIIHKLQNQLPEQLQFTRHRFIRFYTAVVPLLSIGTFILAAIYGGKVWNILSVVLMFNFIFTLSQLKKINAVYLGFSGSSGLLNAFSSAVKWTERKDWKSKYIIDFFSNDADKGVVSGQIKRLSGIINAFDARLNMIVGGFLNLFFLWDLRCAIRLDQWYAASATELVHGLYRISQFEVLISFATLSHNEPEWVFPELSSTFKLHVVDLGHPLIAEARRVVNSYDFNAQPTADIITGSNMAGKSTFLRTVGINMVLAFAGSVVCAREMQTSIFNLLSYMRIKDSLNDQTSTFKAELNRLKMILDSIDRYPDALVLIDEMLRGTNSKDKFLGSRVFIERLIDRHTPALFATHDLQLSEMTEQYPVAVRNYHFDIQLAEGEMKFDYKLKDGPCRTFNAALLLKEIGLTLN
ncbi:MutS-related protein [Pedobacter duraquae]|uniref:MutS-like protein n=1 Tax=Pedobacter duraquae TaxID=425511 RepID=A0A4R6IIK1_9SPHI|nr:DNA mismatch repair protein MutS [Pedobacter duraquae]TDO21809.1 MutS-like protein [Pedobacter duraquae]